jgi:hypothetical protein
MRRQERRCALCSAEEEPAVELEAEASDSDVAADRRRGRRGGRCPGRAGLWMEEGDGGGTASGGRAGAGAGGGGGRGAVPRGFVLSWAFVLRLLDVIYGLLPGAPIVRAERTICSACLVRSDRHLWAPPV